MSWFEVEHVGIVEDHLMHEEEDIMCVTPGEFVASEKDFMRGHGTFIENGQLLSSLAGRVIQVNKLISVQASKGRFMGEVGDIVVGRVKKVQQKQWLVDVNTSQDSKLKLSSIALPGSIQRRKLESDELEIRRFFIEGELLCAEIQAVHQDGSTSLHTRSTKYGKLNGGILIKVTPRNIKRSKNHFIQFQGGLQLDMVIGLNGLIWLGAHRPPVQEEADQYLVPCISLSTDQFTWIAELRQIIITLDRFHLPIYGSLIQRIHQLAFRERTIVGVYKDTNELLQYCRSSLLEHE